MLHAHYCTYMGMGNVSIAPETKWEKKGDKMFKILISNTSHSELNAVSWTDKQKGGFSLIH